MVWSKPTSRRINFFDCHTHNKYFCLYGLLNIVSDRPVSVYKCKDQSAKHPRLRRCGCCCLSLCRSMNSPNVVGVVFFEQHAAIKLCQVNIETSPRDIHIHSDTHANTHVHMATHADIFRDVHMCVCVRSFESESCRLAYIGDANTVIELLDNSLESDSFHPLAHDSNGAI